MVTVPFETDPFAMPKAVGPEVYALSMETLRRLGELACRGSSREGVIAAGLAYADFAAGAAENLKTDKELSHLLDVARTYDFEVENGRAVAADGTPMIDIVRRGHEASQAEASKDPRKRVQAARDYGDVLTAEAVDALANPGDVYAVLSMCPEEAFSQGIDMGGLGYVPGMSFVQVYVNVGGKITAHCLSVEASSKQDWRAVLGAFGLDVPADTPADEWIRHGLRANMPIKDALGLAGRIRESYYRQIGQTHRRYSVTDFLRQHDAIVQRYFDHYIRPLATALYSGENNETMQGLAAALLQTISADVLDDTEMKSELARLADGEPEFTAASGRTMERLVRYALVEDLRARLGAGISSGNHDWFEPADPQPAGAMSGGMPAAAMHAQLARHVQAGIQAKRSYSGCAGLHFIKDGADEEPGAEIGNPQEPYGGKAKDNERQAKSEEACDYWIDNCYCSKYDDDGSESKSRWRVHVRRDPDGKAHCMRAGCGACLGPNGEVIDIGGIARRARQKTAGSKAVRTVVTAS